MATPLETAQTAPAELEIEETASAVPTETASAEPEEAQPRSQDQNWRVYVRKRRNQKAVEPITVPMQSHESDQAPENEITTGNSKSIHTNTSNLDMPIALRKGVRTCTQHPIEKYMSYGKLSQGYKAFVPLLDSTHVQRNIQEAFQHPEWTSELRASSIGKE